MTREDIEKLLKGEQNEYYRTEYVRYLLECEYAGIPLQKRVPLRHYIDILKSNRIKKRQ